MCKTLRRTLLVFGALGVLTPAAQAQITPRGPDHETARPHARRAVDLIARRGPADGQRYQRLKLATAARRLVAEQPDRRTRWDIDRRDFFVMLVPAQIPEVGLIVTTGERIHNQLDLLWSQLVPAVFFLLLLLMGRRAWRDDPAMLKRCSGAYGSFSLYFALAGFVVMSGLTSEGLQRTLHLLSLFVLVLGIIQTLTVFVVDGFFERGRNINVPVIVRDVTTIALFIVSSIIVLSNFGVDLTGILTGSVVLTAVVGLAFQDTLGSIASGLALQVEQPFEENDWIQYDGGIGRVLEINWRSTKLVTPANETVHIPNGQLTSSRLVNLSRPDPFHRRQVTVGLPYATPPNQCKKLLEEAARTAGVLSEPAPFAVIEGFGDSSVAYTLHFFISRIHDYLRIEDRVRTNIWYRLSRAGISIPFPIRDITVHQVEAADVTAREQQAYQARLAALQAIPFLDPLTEGGRRTLAQGMTEQTFGAGETVIQQGEDGDSLFFVRDGEVEVLVQAGGSNGAKRVAIIGAGEFFGEMSLMTGERRAATVRTITDATFFVIEHDAFGALLDDEKELVARIAPILTARNTNLQRERREMTTRQAQPVPEPVEESMLDRIRDFFGL